jgi:hypothetical protein
VFTIFSPPAYDLISIDGNNTALCPSVTFVYYLPILLFTIFSPPAYEPISIDAACAILMPQPAHVDLVITHCHQPRTPFYLCELPTSSTSLTKPQLEHPTKAKFSSKGTLTKDVSFPFPVVTCPDGHVTHTFLAVSVDCWASTRTRLSNNKTDSDMSSALTSFPLFACESGVQRVAYSLVCDHHDDCSDASDEDFCSYETVTKLNESCYFGGPNCPIIRGVWKTYFPNFIKVKCRPGIIQLCPSVRRLSYPCITPRRQHLYLLCNNMKWIDMHATSLWYFF